MPHEASDPPPLEAGEPKLTATVIVIPFHSTLAVRLPFSEIPPVSNNLDPDQTLCYFLSGLI